MKSKPSQPWNAEQYQRHASFVPALGEDVLELLAPQAGERILDLGCGDGQLTTRLLDAGCSVLAVDSSHAMVIAARQRGLEVQQMDGQNLTAAPGFDAVFSNAALHWMTEPEKVLSGVWRALKPGGRFAAEFGGAGNVASVVAALDAALGNRGLKLDSPWFFPTPDEYRQILSSRGFNVQAMHHFPRPTQLPGDLEDWLRTFAQSWLSALPEQDQLDFMKDVVALLKPSLCDQEGQWRVDYVRLRVLAVKPVS